MLKISSSGTSNAGQKKINEDNFYMNGIFIAEGNAWEGGLYSDSKRRNMQFYAVFDGIGEEVESSQNPNITFHDGQSSSFLAAHMISNLQNHIIKLRKSGRPYNLSDAVYKYVQKTNQQLFINMQKKGVRSGASFALLCIDGIKICAYNIGNSKIFILRDGRLTLLTQNDTKVEEMIYANQISQDIAQYAPENKILTQYLGLYPNEKQAELHINNKLTLNPGDKFLLCSDGLCDSVADSRMLEIMLKDISEQETIRELVKEAEQNGVRENMTAIVVCANVSDDVERVNKLRARTAGTPAQFKPLPLSYRKKFTFTPKMIKMIAFYALILTLAIVAVVVIVNRFIGDTPSTQTTESTTPTISSTKRTTTERTTTSEIEIPTHDYSEEGMNIDGATEEITEQPTATPPAITTVPPVVTTAAPTTRPPNPTPPPVVTTDPPQNNTTITEPPDEATTAPAETTTTADIAEDDTTEPVTEAPETTEPLANEETQPPETTTASVAEEPPETTEEEPTIAAEPPDEE